MIKGITLPDEKGMLEKLLAVDEELKSFAPYFFHWAGKTIRDPWQMLSIILAAIELYVEKSGATVANRGALVHYSPEIVKALCGQNRFADLVQRDLKEVLDHVGIGRR